MGPQAQDGILGPQAQSGLLGHSGLGLSRGDPLNLTDNDRSVAKYRVKAEGYDHSAQRTMPLRRQVIAGLQLQPGQVVLDVGAGTGLSYELLLAGVGSTGRLLAFEQSPEMFAKAQQRVQAGAWSNVWHCCEAAERVRLPQMADAVLFNYVHDVSRTPQAVANIMDQVRPGARVAMAGMKFFPPWLAPLNLLAWLKNRPYNVKAADLMSPWDIVAGYCDEWQIRSTQWGMGYLAWGNRK